MNECAWWGGLTTGPTRACSAKCFGLMNFAGWFEPARVAARNTNNRRDVETRTATMETTSYSDSGILFKNENKSSDRDPAYKGTITAECEKCHHRTHRTLAAWIKVARNGSKFMSLSFKPRSDQQTGAPRDDASF